MYQAMKEADQDYDGTLHSRSGLVGTDGGKLEHYVEQEEPICGDFPWARDGKGGQNGRVQRLYETNCRGAYGGCVRRCAGSFLSMQEKISLYG